MFKVLILSRFTYLFLLNELRCLKGAGGPISRKDRSDERGKKKSQKLDVNNSPFLTEAQAMCLKASTVGFKVLLPVDAER